MSRDEIMNNNREECKICSSQKTSKHFEKNGYDIYRCFDCGVLFAATPEFDHHDMDTILNLYAKSYFQDNAKNTLGYRDYIQDKKEEKERIAAFELAAIEKRKPDKGRLLDVGCAAGFFLHVAQERGWHVAGIEPAEYAARYARNRMGLDVKTGTLETVDLPKNYYDVVTAWDVIEHVLDPLQFIEQAHGLLRKEGLLVLGTPNSVSLAAQLKRRAWVHIRPPEHLFYFNPKSLGYLCRKYFDDYDIVQSRAYYSKIKPTLKNISKRFLFRVFNNFSYFIGLGEYVKVYARKP